MTYFNPSQTVETVKVDTANQGGSNLGRSTYSGDTFIDPTTWRDGGAGDDSSDEYNTHNNFAYEFVTDLTFNVGGSGLNLWAPFVQPFESGPFQVWNTLVGVPVKVQMFLNWNFALPIKPNNKKIWMEIYYYAGSSTLETMVSTAAPNPLDAGTAYDIDSISTWENSYLFPANSFVMEATVTPARAGYITTVIRCAISGDISTDFPNWCDVDPRPVLSAA